MANVQFNTPINKIHPIVGRALGVLRAAGYRKPDRQDVMMDLDAVNSNGCPLDFDKLAGFDDFDFAHDIVGIYKNLDRNTGQLTDHFIPRCALSKGEPTNAGMDHPIDQEYQL